MRPSGRLSSAPAHNSSISDRERNAPDRWAFRRWRAAPLKAAGTNARGATLIVASSTVSGVLATIINISRETTTISELLRDRPLVTH